MTLLAFTSDGLYIDPPNYWLNITRFTGLFTTAAAVIAVFFGIVFLLLRDWLQYLKGYMQRRHQVMIGASDFAVDVAERQGKVTIFDTAEKLERLAQPSRNPKNLLKIASRMDAAVRSSSRPS